MSGSKRLRKRCPTDKPRMNAAINCQYCKHQEVNGSPTSRSLFFFLCSHAQFLLSCLLSFGHLHTHTHTHTNIYMDLFTIDLELQTW